MKSFRGAVSLIVLYEKILTKNMEGRWLLGTKLTYVDFLLFEFLDHIRLLEPELIAGFDKLTKFLADFEALPNIKEYLNSERFNSFPLYGERSYIGRQKNDVPKL